MMGLLRAVETYDNNKSAFETWAWFWIRSFIRGEVRRFKHINMVQQETFNPKSSIDIRIMFKQISGNLDSKYTELLSRFLAGQNPVEISRDWGVSRQAIDQRIERMIQRMKEET
tara:strand:+ start:5304 stop:5645 length:342 start_codon:yes stop_codon:yes gene_type:complete